jgi:peptide/nickel transport system substrate-binding protein
MSARNPGGKLRRSDVLVEVLLERRKLLKGGAALGLAAAGLHPTLGPALAQDSSATPTTATPTTGDGTLGYEIEPAQHEGGTIISASGSILRNWSLATGGFQGVSESLVEINPHTFQPEPLLATSWEASEDSKVWTFYLRDGVKWHDGEPFTAEDVKFSIELHANEENVAATIVDTYSWAIWVDTIEVVDPLTVKMTLVSPIVDFALYTYVFTIMAKHVVEGIAPADLVNSPASTGSDPAAVVFTGPFKFKEYVPQEQMVLERNDDYWGGKPHLDQWIIKEIPDTSAQVVQLQAGDLDFSTGVPPAAADRFSEEDFTVHRVSTTSYSIYYYQLDPERSPFFQDQRVRQALLHAIDRDAMLQAVYFGFGTVPVGLFTHESWAANPDGIEHLYPYDPEKAKQLLDEAGWVDSDGDGIREKDGVKLQPNMVANSSNIWQKDTPAAIQAYWREVGVELIPEILAPDLYEARVTVDFDFDTALRSQGSGVTVDRTFAFKCENPHGGGNRGFYCNERVDEIIDIVAETPDRETRKELLTEMQNIILEELPVGPLVWKLSPAPVNKRVHNLFPNAVDVGGGGFGFNAETWWIDE